MKPKHIWVIEDEDGTPRVTMGGAVNAYGNRVLAAGSAKYFSANDQCKYKAVKYVREK